MMQSIRRHRRRNLAVKAEINFTNLIDIAFVLLIIFMITAPIMQGGIELELPSVTAQPLTTPDAVVVSVTQDGRIFMNDVEVTLERFAQEFRGYMALHEGQPISVGGDARVPYGRLMDVFNVLRELGYTDVQLLTQPVTPRRRAGRG